MKDFDALRRDARQRLDRAREQAQGLPDPDPAPDWETALRWLEQLWRHYAAAEASVIDRLEQYCLRSRAAAAAADPQQVLGLVTHLLCARGRRMLVVRRVWEAGSDNTSALPALWERTAREALHFAETHGPLVRAAALRFCGPDGAAEADLTAHLHAVTKLSPELEAAFAFNDAGTRTARILEFSAAVLAAWDPDDPDQALADLRRLVVSTLRGGLPDGRYHAREDGGSTWRRHVPAALLPETGEPDAALEGVDAAATLDRLAQGLSRQHRAWFPHIRACGDDLAKLATLWGVPLNTARKRRDAVFRRLQQAVQQDRNE